MLQLHMWAGCVQLQCDKIRRKTKHSGTYLHTKGRSWRGGAYIYIYHSNIMVPYHPDTTVVEMDIANNKTYSFKTCNLRDFRTKHGDDTRLSSLWEHEACSAPRRFNIGIAAKTVYANKTANPERDEKKKQVGLEFSSSIFLGLAIS